MFLTHWKPSGLTRSLWNFDDFFSDLDQWSNGNRPAYSPAVDIREEEGRYVILADLPGLKEKEIEVKVHDGTLLLAGKREETQEEKKEGAYYSERRHGSFCRQFRLGSAVDADKIEASYKEGVLTVMLPKKAEAKPKQIPVAIG